MPRESSTFVLFRLSGRLDPLFHLDPPSNLTLDHQVRLLIYLSCECAPHPGRVNRFLCRRSWIHFYLLTGGIVTVLHLRGGSFAEKHCRRQCWFGRFREGYWLQSYGKEYGPPQSRDQQKRTTVNHRYLPKVNKHIITGSIVVTDEPRGSSWPQGFSGEPLHFTCFGCIFIAIQKQTLTAWCFNNQNVFNVKMAIVWTFFLEHSSQQ